eukprot:SAG25_NODE_81_length_16694_cov_8.663332_3_plen_115_part_00
MGPGKYECVGKSQSVLVMTDPIIFTGTRRGGVGRVADVGLLPRHRWWLWLHVRLDLEQRNHGEQGAGATTNGAPAHGVPSARRTGGRRSVSRAFPSWNRSILTEIYLCHACSCQ